MKLYKRIYLTAEVEKEKVKKIMINEKKKFQDDRKHQVLYIDMPIHITVTDVTDKGIIIRRRRLVA